MIRQASSNMLSILAKSAPRGYIAQGLNRTMVPIGRMAAAPRIARMFSSGTPTDPNAPKMDVDGSDPDFRPKDKPAAAQLTDKEILAQIEGWVKNNPLVLFMKGNPQQPMCGYSRFVVEVLKYYNVQGYKSVDVLKDANVRRLVKEYSDWQTFPQLYVKGELVGGCDIVTEMHKKGTLHEVLDKAKN